MPEVDVKQAVSIAQKYTLELFPKAANIRLEEVEAVETGVGNTFDRWDVTLSFFDHSEEPTPRYGGAMAQAIEAATGIPAGPYLTRHYKIFSIDRSSGDVRAMKIRKL